MPSQKEFSTYVIGDIQGCDCQLEQLLQQVTSSDRNAHFIFAGDLVNRGPDSLSALRRIRALEGRARVVLGNHDLHVLAVACGARKPGRSDTIAPLLDAPDREDLLGWLRRQPLALMEEQCLVVHAGVLPPWSASRTLELAHEVETVLQGPGWIDFLHVMYGNQPARWDDGLQGIERLRCIVNALTRMRYCMRDGTMALDVKEDASGGDDGGLVPWFDAPGRKTKNTTVVFGHWSMLGLTLREDVICLDSGCVWGGQLTALRLSDRGIFQVSCPQYQAPG